MIAEHEADPGAPAEMAEKRGVFRVAESAGVSIATVSRAFNEPALVREDVRKRILEVANALGYVPNSAAKALRLQRTHIVGAVIPTLDHAIYARLVNAFQAQMSASGYTVVVLAVGFDNTHVAASIKQVVERGAEALMIVGSIEDDELRHFLKTKRTPVVQTYSYASERDHPAVGFDNAAAMRAVIDHLLKLGHRHLAMLAGPTRGNDRQIARVGAFHAALAQAGIEAGPVIEKRYTFQHGIDALGEIRADHPRTTAIVCSSDILAFGVLHACRGAGLSVPDDMSVTGFDDLDFAALLDPPLTTIAIGADEMGRIAGERIVVALEGGPAEGLCLPTRLVLRASTAGPRARLMM
jgi:LacI family transcriptional regulator